jgi:sec-independent protein translocase protein TatC
MKIVDDIKKPIVEHISELRRRIIVIISVVIIGTIVSYIFREKLIDLILKPVRELEFIYLTPPELFLAYVKIALVVGIIATSPIIFWQIWVFLVPGLKKKEKIYLGIAIVVGYFLFLLGGYFAYRVIIPITIDFFVRLSTETIQPQFSFGNYTGFISSILLSFGIVFELPILIALLTKFNLITASILRKYRKYLILVIFIAASFLSPPDLVSQLLLAAPLLVLFEISVLISQWLE